ncbi:hypothetical protein GCM10010510_65570 [Streptomyces anandii JCM 4720]|nr:hypothetical protein GCM10010510_65570 [Streptomyces anandii JCM 4720]
MKVRTVLEAFGFRPLPLRLPDADGNALEIRKPPRRPGHRGLAGSNGLIVLRERVWRMHTPGAARRAV